MENQFRSFFFACLSKFYIFRLQSWSQKTTTECATDLDKQSKMIIFESTLTTFEASVSFEAVRAVAKMGSSLKSIHRKQIKLVQICETLCRYKDDPMPPLPGPRVNRWHESKKYFVCKGPLSWLFLNCFCKGKAFAANRITDEPILTNFFWTCNISVTCS